MATLNIIADEIGDALGRPFDWMFKARIKSIFRHEAYLIIKQSIDKDGMTDYFKTKFSVELSVVDNTDAICGTCDIRSTNKIADPIRYRTDEPFTFVGNKDGTVIYIYTKLTELPYADLTEVYAANPIRYIYQNKYLYLKNNGGTCGSITNIVDYAATVAGTVLVTSEAHDLTTGNKVDISSTTDYNATYTITVVDVDTFYVTATYVADETSGSWKRNMSSICLSVEGAYPFGDVFATTPEESLNDNVFDDDTTLPIPEDLIQAIKLRLLDGELSIIDSKDKITPDHIDN